MKPVKLRIFAPQSISKEDVAAVAKAAKAFKPYGVQSDIVEPTKASMKSVRYGSFVSDVLSNPATCLVSELYYGRPLDKIREVLFTRERIGIGITDKGLFTQEGDMRRELIGAGLFGSAAFISTNLLSALSPGMRNKAIETAALHEIGHAVMDKDGHCDSEKCVMHASEKSLERFLDMAAKELGFCRSCQSAIGKGILILESGALVRGEPASVFDDI
jgi:hypothetical protein